MDKRFEQQMDFLLEMDKSKQITRQTYLADGSRKENDAEHAWHMSLMLLILAEYADTPFDKLKAVTMSLIHDIIEIDAGDTYAYDEVGMKSKKEREEKAADRLFALLPKDQEKYYRSLFEEFEEGITPEAKFASAMDCVQPMMLNDASNGKSWDEHHPQCSSIRKRGQRIERASSYLAQYMNQIISKNVTLGHIKKDEE